MTQITHLRQKVSELEASSRLAKESQAEAVGEYDRLRNDITNLNKRIISIQEQKDQEIQMMRNELDKTRNEALVKL